jgi:phenylalanyl-tRNA synthetase alpha subunit
LGIERVAILRYAIPDMRLLLDPDIRFLQQWSAVS